MVGVPSSTWVWGHLQMYHSPTSALPGHLFRDCHWHQRQQAAHLCRRAELVGGQPWHAAAAVPMHAARAPVPLVCQAASSRLALMPPHPYAPYICRSHLPEKAILVIYLPLQLRWTSPCWMAAPPAAAASCTTAR